MFDLMEITGTLLLIVVVSTGVAPIGSCISILDYHLELFGKVQGVTLLEEVYHWQAGRVFVVSKAHAFTVYLSLSHGEILEMSHDVRSQLLLWSHACLPAAMILAMTVMDSNPLKLNSRQSFYQAVALVIVSSQEEKSKLNIPSCFYFP